jgi:hypothetical protein
MYIFTFLFAVLRKCHQNDNENDSKDMSHQINAYKIAIVPNLRKNLITLIAKIIISRYFDNFRKKLK